MKMAGGIIQTSQFELVWLVLKQSAGIDIGEVDNTDSPYDGGRRLINSLFTLLDKTATWAFGLIIGAVGLYTLYRAARTGQFMTKSSAMFGTLMLIMGVMVATGAFTIIIQVLMGISIVLALIVYYVVFPPILNEMSLDVNGTQTRFQQAADDFAVEYVEALVQMNMDDIAARKNILVEAGNLGTDIYGRFTIEDYKFINCLANTSPDAPNYKFYIPPEIKNSMACSESEFDWNVYSVGYIADEKADSVSLGVMTEMYMNQSVYRQIAMSIINTNCTNIFNRDRDIATLYQTACMNMNADGSLVIEDGHLVTVDSKHGLNDEALKARLENAYKRLAGVAYIEMLKQANLVAKPDELKSMSIDNMAKIFMLGSAYRHSYEEAGMKVIDLKRSDEVAIKKKKFQLGFGKADNLQMFNGDGSDTTFNIDEYYNKLKSTKQTATSAMAILDNISGKSASNMGMQYVDCFQKAQCNSANYNFFAPLVDVAKLFTGTVAVFYGVSVVVGEYYKKIDDSLGGKDPYYNAKVHYMNGVQMFFLGLILAVVIGGLAVLAVQILIYLKWFMEGIALFFLFPFVFGGAILIHAGNILYRDDHSTFNDLLKRHGFWDMMLRFPLIVMGSAIGLIVLNIMMTLASIILSVMFSSNFGLFDGAGFEANIVGGMTYMFLYIITFIATFFVVINTVNEGISTAISELCYGGDNDATAVDGALSKIKNQIGKLRG
ncbi:hypothetical protein C0J26_07640 [Pseudomonas baetica]|nr:hypothetical protein C0J26_07640 [Pseudomonas baetica]